MAGAGRIAIFSSGLWALRGEVEALSGLTPQFGGQAEAIAGWGHKPTAHYTRHFAAERAIPYIAFEDGFLRSIRPGTGMRPASMVMDRTGIYYDARGPAELEDMIIAGGFTEAERAEAREAMALLRRLRISKYNHAPEDFPEGLSVGYVLVIDQTYGDASIPGALANAASFASMLDLALAQSGGREVVAKVHPDALTRKKSGHLAPLCAGRNVRLIASLANPWPLLENASEVHCVSSQLGFEALLAGKPVTCHGLPFYAGWGLTADKVSSPRRGTRRSLEDVFAAAYLRYPRYFDLWTRKPVSAATSIQQLAFLRDRYLGNNRRIVAFGVTPWKRKPLQALLQGPAPPIAFEGSAASAIAKAKALDAGVLAWGRNANLAAQGVAAEGLTLISAEDGFLRSVGLGAAFSRSMSFSLDRRGIYYDSSRPSDLEALLSECEIPPQQLAAAARLREVIVANRITKYNVAAGNAAPFKRPPGRKIILVIGQVADDEAVRLSCPPDYLAIPMAEGGANLALIREARRRNPHAFIAYKPHPDVETVGRLGAVHEPQLQGLADVVLRNQSMSALFGEIDELEVLSSLAGFEALLRGLPVTTHGQPFYAGWGLTQDLHPPPRRGRRRSLDELVAIALIIYPHYLDPVSGLPCPIDIVLGRLQDEKVQPLGLHKKIRAAGGLAAARARIAWKRATGG